MKRRKWRLVALLLCVPLASTPLAMILFGSAPAPDDAPAAVESGPGLDSRPTVELTALLTRPRSELAALAGEVATKIGHQNDAHADGRLPFSLTPQLDLALDVPVMRDAHFVASREISLPPYVKDDAHDTEVARHLARFGDVEAALKLMDPADSEARKQIESYRYERNYPVEWTRLVGLLLHEAELRLVTGDLTGGGELIGLHRQLREALDGKAAAGPLGAALFTRGHKVLRMAGDSLREQGKNEEADKVASVLADWGPLPAPPLAFALGAPRADVLRQLDATGTGRGVPVNAARALDLLYLPVAGEGVEAAVVFFEDDRLAEVLVTYRGRISERFRNPTWLALPLEDRDLKAQAEAPAVWFPKRTYDLGQLQCELGMSYRGQSLGAFARFRDGKQTTARQLTRDFGVVCLDRSYEQNRVRLAPGAIAESVRTSHAAVLKAVVNPLAPWRPTQAALHRVSTAKENGARPRSQAADTLFPGPGYENRTARFALEFPADQDLPPLAQIAKPLWAEFGPGRIEPAETETGDYLALVWDDARTRYTIRLPNGAQPTAEFLAENLTTGVDAEQQRAAVAAFDQAERKERFAQKAYLIRIPRNVGIEGIELGATREAVTAAAEALEGVTQVPFSHGLGLVFTGDSAIQNSCALRQVFVRFDQSGRVVELRARYHDNPGGTPIAVWGPEVLAGWKKRCGAPHAGVIPGGWSEFPNGKTAALYRWVDDVTVAQLELQSCGAEIVLRACAEGDAAGVPLPAFQYLLRGPDGCVLGMKKEEILARWKGSRSGIQGDGALDLTPPANCPFDAIRVWFVKDRVARIVALYREPVPSKPDDAAQALQASWNDQLGTFGWVWRQDFTSQGTLQSLGWQDERTRLRLFWEKAPKNPPRIYSEWKDLEQK